MMKAVIEVLIRHTFKAEVSSREELDTMLERMIESAKSGGPIALHDCTVHSGTDVEGTASLLKK